MKRWNEETMTTEQKKARDLICEAITDENYFGKDEWKITLSDTQTKSLINLIALELTSHGNEILEKAIEIVESVSEWDADREGNPHRLQSNLNTNIDFIKKELRGLKL